MHTFKSHATCFTAISCYLHVLTETSMFENKTKKTWSVKKSYYNSKYHSAVVRSSNCSLSSAVQNQILMLTFKKKKQTFKIVLLSEYYNCSKARLTKWSSVAEWLECWTPVNFTRARGPGFDSWSDSSKFPGLRTVTWSRVQRVDQEKHD